MIRPSRVPICSVLLLLLGCGQDLEPRLGSIRVVASGPPASVSGATLMASRGSVLDPNCGGYLDRDTPDLVIHSSSPLHLRARATSPIGIAALVSGELHCGALREDAELALPVASEAQVWVISAGSGIPFELSVGPLGPSAPTVDAPPTENMVSVTSTPTGRDVVLEDGTVAGQTPLMFAWQGESTEVALSVDFGEGTKVDVRGVLTDGELDLHADEPPTTGYNVVAQTDAALALPANADVEARIFIGQPCAVVSATIDIGATHADPALMRATLVAPNGARVPLHQYQSGQNGGVNKRLNSADHPELDVLRGVSARGAWLIRANAGARDGMLNGVTLSLDCVAPGIPIGAAPPTAAELQVASVTPPRSSTGSSRSQRTRRRVRQQRARHSGFQIVQAYPGTPRQRRRMAAQVRAARARQAAHQQGRHGRRSGARKPTPGVTPPRMVRRRQEQELVNPWH